MLNLSKHSFLILGIILFSSISRAYPGLEEVMDFGSNPGNLAFYKYVPEQLKESKDKVPLVVVLHGCNQSAGAIARISDWNMLADKHNFCVAYPEQRMINNPSRCFNWYMKKDMHGQEGEVESIDQIVRYMLNSHSIDSSNIYVYGVSAGAAIGVCYIANHPQIVKSGAILAGSAYGMAENVLDGAKVLRFPKQLSRAEWKRRFKEASPEYEGPYPRLVAIQGLNDLVVHYDHSRQLVNQFLELHGLDSIPRIEDNFKGTPGLMRMSFYDKDSSEAVVLYEMEDLGHALMVNPCDYSEYCGGKTGAFARDVSWFSTYWIAKDFGLIIGKKEE